jgi:RNA 2',3'-cyclic 3'-phosphodiesterase
VRLFVAADLPAEVRAGLEAIQKALQSVLQPVRWTRTAGIHLTLKFMGEVAADRLGAIDAALRAAGLGVRPFRLEAAGVGTFPESGAPRVIWVGVRGDLEGLTVLREAIERSLSGLGFSAEKRDYHPHLTLGRIQGPVPSGWRSRLARTANATAGAFSVDEYVLFESRLGPRGPDYNALARYPLADGESS